jgi:hypothetical protein
MSKYRIQKYKKTLTLLFATNSTVITETNVDLNGFLTATTVKTAAAVDSSATTAVKLTDADGVDVFSRTGLAVNTNAQALLADATRVPLNGLYTITVTFSAAQTANRATDVTLLIDRG